VDFASQVVKAAPDFFGVSKNSVPAEILAWWTRQILDRCSIKVLSELYKTMMETDFRPEIQTIKTPTLILQGDIDKSAPLESTGQPTHESWQAAGCWYTRMPHTPCRTRIGIACWRISSRLRDRPRPSKALKSLHFEHVQLCP
jgi:pimeloyl-ACP methyl ester carboxylesterase